MAADTTITDHWVDTNTYTTLIDWANAGANSAITAGAVGSGTVSIGNGGSGGTGGFYSVTPSNGGFTSISPNGLNTVWTTNTNYTYNVDPTLQAGETRISSREIQMDNPEADIKIRGTSLMDRIEKIEQRLGIINRNSKLEEGWPELRELAEQYQKLEQELTDKQAVWDRLNQPMPKAAP